MIRLLMIADDFTGALDTGVQFAACGVATRVITGQNVSLKELAGTCEVLVVDAETRHMPSSAAHAVVYGIVAQAVELGVPHIYKKTDSALRGNVGGELTALMEASGEESLPFLPAFPQMDRNTLDGVHYINGVPVAESVFGADPFEPVRHSRVADLIAEQSDVAVHSFPALTENAPIPQEGGIWVFDASSQAALENTGKRLLAAGKLRIMAGCAGFGAVLPELLHLGNGKPTPMPTLEKNFLVICGSVNPITVAQLDHA